MLKGSPKIARKIPPAILDKLVVLAGIRNGPAATAGIREHPYAVLAPILPTPTAQRLFEIRIEAAVRVAHIANDITNAAKLRAYGKRIAKHAAELERLFNKMSVDQKTHLSTFLPGARPLGSALVSVRDLVEAGRRIQRAKSRERKRPSKIGRQVLIETLLDAAAEGGGRLTLDRRSERGTLIEVLELLAPYLPQEITAHLSTSTVRRDKTGRGGQKLQK